MEFLELAKKRFSQRCFTEKPLEKEKLEKILEAGRAAPSAKDAQAWHVYVVQKKENLDKIDGMTICRYNAPVVLIFTYDKDTEWNNPADCEAHSGIQDVSIAAVHMMLQATELGVDSIWINRFPNSELDKVFGFPPNEKSVLFMPLGYGEEDAGPSVRHNARKTLEELVTYM